MHFEPLTGGILPQEGVHLVHYSVFTKQLTHYWSKLPQQHSLHQPLQPKDSEDKLSWLRAAAPALSGPVSVVRNLLQQHPASVWAEHVQQMNPI